MGGEASRAGWENWPGLKEDQLCPEGRGGERVDGEEKNEENGME